MALNFVTSSVFSSKPSFQIIVMISTGMPSGIKVNIDNEGVDSRNENSLFCIALPIWKCARMECTIWQEIRRLRSFLLEPHRPYHFRWVQQSGTVTNIEKLLLPSGYRLPLPIRLRQYLQSKNFNQSTSVSTASRAGLDLKYGINDAFTLDMTLIPDFGQVLSDKQVLNLGPFEVFFAENRQFLRRAQELFNKGRLFYSRRIGGDPSLQRNKWLVGQGETIINNPETTQLINATKVSGRTIVKHKHWCVQRRGMKVLQNSRMNLAWSGECRPILIPITIPGCWSKSEKQLLCHFVNTNVWRQGADYDANVTGGFNFKTKSQNYFVSGWCCVEPKSIIPIYRPGLYVSPHGRKGGGNWTYEAGHGVESITMTPMTWASFTVPMNGTYMEKEAIPNMHPKTKDCNNIPSASIASIPDFMNLIVSVILSINAVRLYSGKQVCSRTWCNGLSQLLPMIILNPELDFSGTLWAGKLDGQWPYFEWLQKTGGFTILNSVTEISKQKEEQVLLLH